MSRYQNDPNQLHRLIELLAELHPHPHLLNVYVNTLIRDIPVEKVAKC
ncbi:MAG: hypothetical protein HWD61_15665 [Parachlamydiaceae bacterium]|nr:MAG: hypothetical protein HWD61_15665 [Parachlamydiaceae bacterium]